MGELIKKANDILLAPAGLDESVLASVVGRAMGGRIDSADLYLQCSEHESWSLEDGIVKSGDFSIDRGFGLRVMFGEKSGFAFSDGIEQQSLLSAATTAKSIAQSGDSKTICLQDRPIAPALYPAINPLYSLSDERKIQLLHEADQYARSLDSRIEQVFVSLTAEYDVVMILNNLGELVADVRPQINFRISVIAVEQGRRERGSSGGGGRAGYQLFESGDLIKGYVDLAVNQALINLDATPAPAGMMPVVLGPGWPAVLLHEAVGHGLEGDFNRKGTSAFSGRLGEQVASTLCTVVDDGTIEGRRGSLSVDDEGVASQKTVLIENGILKNYMLDKHNATLMGKASTGNGRRESYACRPIPRMTNTYMLPGQSEPEEIIRSVKKGLYAVDFSGGQVDITSGKFTFSTSEAYLIEDGKITRPVKGATLVGNGPEVMNQISMVGNDLALDKGIGCCGKDGQTVPVGVGQPTLKVDQITVGGSR